MTVKFDVDAALAKVGELVTQYGPQAIDTAAAVVQVDAANSLLLGAAGVVSAWFGGRFCLRQFGAGVAAAKEDEYAATPIFQCIGSGIGAAVLGVVAVTSGITLLNVWNYVAFINPKLALAHAIWERIQ